MRYQPIHSSSLVAKNGDPKDGPVGIYAVQVEPPSVLALRSLKAYAVDPTIRNPTAEETLRSAPDGVSPGCPPTFCVRIDNGALWTRGFVPLTPSGYYLVDSVRTPRLLSGMGLDVGDDMSVELPSDPVAFPEKAVVLGNAQSGNHFHWLFESLARLGILNLGSFGNELQHARYLVPKLRPQQLESLLLAGVPECQLLTVEEPLARFAELYVPSRGLERIYRFSRAAVKYLQSLGIPQRPRRRIYLSRGQARRRIIGNEAEIASVLADKGFETVHAEDMSFGAQLRMFSQTAALVAPHGAGLANIAFMPPGGAVLELQPEGQDYAGSVMYRALSSLAGHRYGIFIGSQAADNSRTMHFDPQILQRAVEDLL